MTVVRFACLLTSLAALILAGCGDDEPATTSSVASGSAGAAGPSGSEPAEASGGGGEPHAQARREASRPTAQPGGAPSVERALDAVLTSKGTPEQACETYVSDDFVARSYGGRANCIAAQRPTALADQVQVLSDSPEGDRRRVVVVPSGGPYDGARVVVVVVADGDSYEVASLDAHVPAGP